MLENHYKLGINYVGRNTFMVQYSIVQYSKVKYCAVPFPHTCTKLWSISNWNLESRKFV